MAALGKRAPHLWAFAEVYIHLGKRGVPGFVLFLKSPQIKHTAFPALLELNGTC